MTSQPSLQQLLLLVGFELAILMGMNWLLTGLCVTENDAIYLNIYWWEDVEKCHGCIWESHLQLTGHVDASIQLGLSSLAVRPQQ